MDKEPISSDSESFDIGADPGDEWQPEGDSRLRRMARRWIWALVGAGWWLVFIAPYFGGSGNRLAWLWYPSDSALGYIGAEIQMVEAAEYLFPPGEGLLGAWFARSRDETLQWCLEIVESTSDYLGSEEARARLSSNPDDADRPKLLANLAILCGEAGDRERMEFALRDLVRERPLMSDFATSCRHLYSGKSPGVAELTVNDYELEFLGSYWPRWLFEQRYRGAIGDIAGEAEIRDWRLKQGQQKGRLLLVMLAVEIGLIAVALVIAGRAFYRWRHREFAILSERPAFPESVRQGAGIFFAGTLAGWFLYWLSSFFPGLGEAVQYQHSFVMGLPVLVTAFALGGFREAWQRTWRDDLWSGCRAFPVIWVIYGTCFYILDIWAPEDAWLDTWRETERGLTGISAWANVVNTVIWAPLFEEIACRWMLYGGLRKGYGVGVSAVGSSLAFALLHQYSWEGNAAVFLFGVLLCLLCERTGSWMPAVIVHAMTNLTIVLWDWVYFG